MYKVKACLYENTYYFSEILKMSSLLKLSLSSTSPHTFPPANHERIILPQTEEKEEIKRFGSILLVFFYRAADLDGSVFI
jgi:hypothetical protein